MAVSESKVEFLVIMKVGIRVFDAVGRLAYDKEGVERGNAVYKIKIDHLSSGLFTVQIRTDQLVMKKRLIKK